jgi:nicotinamide mononucleotide adenylyltransferase
MEDQNKSWEKIYHVKSSMSNSDSGFSMFLGRWQPLHEGHKELFNQEFSLGKNVCIMIREMDKDSKNPFSPEDVMKNIMDEFRDFYDSGRLKILIVPNITSINFGRSVGYDIIEHVPPQNVAEISATKIREKMKIG